MLLLPIIYLILSIAVELTLTTGTGESAETGTGVGRTSGGTHSIVQTRITGAWTA